MTARAMRFRQTGGPEVLEIVDVDAGTPGPGEVRLEVRALGLNRADVLFRQGMYVEDPQLPSGLGIDAAGIVADVGPGVPRFVAGDRVLTFPAASAGQYPTHATSAIYPENGLLPVPAGVGFEEAAAAGTSYFTAYFPLLETARLQPGHTLLVTAGSSPVALAALQIAQRIGARTIATTRTTAKRQDLLAAGYDAVVVTEEEDVASRVRDVTDGNGADVVYDSVAGPGLPALVAATADRGHVFVLGAFGGETPLPLFDLFRRSVRLHAGYKVFDYTGHAGFGLHRDHAATDRAKLFVSAGLTDGWLSPTIAARLRGLDAYADAHREMERSQQIGKIIVTLP